MRTELNTWTCSCTARITQGVLRATAALAAAAAAALAASVAGSCQMSCMTRRPEAGSAHSSALWKPARRYRPLSSHSRRAAVTRTQAVRQSAREGDRCCPSEPRPQP